MSFVCPFTCLSFHRHSCSPFATQSVSAAFCLYTLHVMVFMLVFLLVCAPCEDGFFFLQLLPVCCWRCHVMSIMGSPSCLEPELAASAFVFFAWSLRSFPQLLLAFMLWCRLLASLAALSAWLALRVLHSTLFVLSSWRSCYVTQRPERPPADDGPCALQHPWL